MMPPAMRRKFFLEAGCGSETYGQSAAGLAPRMTREQLQPRSKAVAAAVVTVAANYVYFLVFAQFGFLKILQAGPGATAGLVKPVLTVMGLAGIAAFAGGSAGRFQMTRADAEALDKRTISQQEYFVRKVLY